MPPIRRSNRAPKPKVHWEPPTTNPYRQPPAFTIYNDPPAPPNTQPFITQSSTIQPSITHPGMQPPGEPYQPYFLPKNRAGKPQNLPKDIKPIKLFQLFFTVKEIENIVKQTNSRGAKLNHF